VDGPADFGAGEREERLVDGPGEGDGLLRREMDDNLSKA
jgi:hypothetical protein